MVGVAGLVYWRRKRRIGDRNDGTRILNGDLAEKAGSLLSGSGCAAGSSVPLHPRLQDLQMVRQ